MFEGFSAQTIDFMWNIRLNNNRAWFEAHKEEYKIVFLEPMKALAQDVFKRFAGACGAEGFLWKVSRIYRDARRIRDGRPYRDHLWFSIEAPSEEWTCTPVFWFELAPEGWRYGMGYYQARSESMAKMRPIIDGDPRAFERLIAPLEKRGEFVLDGPEYARAKQAPTPHTQAWYNRKSITLVHNQPNGTELFSPQLSQHIAEGFVFLKPYYDFLAALG